MCRPLREQARSHRGSAAGFDFPATQIFSVGAKLARDSGGSGCKDVGCVGLFASGLAPTEDLRQASISRLPKSSLWEQSLLAIVVGQVARMLDVSASSRASSLPQGICGRLRFPGYPKSSLWEQSLLAIAVGRLASMLDVPPSSRASFAPTGFALADNWRYVEIRA